MPRNKIEMTPGHFEESAPTVEQDSDNPSTLYQQLWPHSKRLEELLSMLNQPQVPTQDQGIIDSVVLKKNREITLLISQYMEESKIRASQLERKLSAYAILIQEATDYFHAAHLVKEILAQENPARSGQSEDFTENRGSHVLAAFLEEVGGKQAFLEKLLEFDENLLEAEEGGAPHRHLGLRAYFLDLLSLEGFHLVRDEERSEQTLDRLNTIAKREESAFHEYLDYIVEHSDQIEVSHLQEALNSLILLAEKEGLNFGGAAEHKRHKVLRQAFQALKARIDSEDEAQGAQNLANAEAGLFFRKS